MAHGYVSRGTPTWLEDVNGGIAYETRGGQAAGLLAVIELSEAQYLAMPVKDPNIVYRTYEGNEYMGESPFNAGGGGSGITTEQAVDAVAAALLSGTHTNVSVTYDDAGNKINLVVSGVTGGGTTAEEVQDFMNNALVHANHTNISVVYNDAANRFEFTGAATGAGGGDTWLTRKITAVANGQTVTLVVGGFGTTAAINGITVTPTVDGTSSMVLTLGALTTFKLRSVSVNVPASANAGTGFTLVAPDPSGATALADSALASMAIYNDAGATVASTLVTMAMSGSNLSVQKTGLTANTAYRFKVIY